jgi:hypothetical protein
MVFRTERGAGARLKSLMRKRPEFRTARTVADLRLSPTPPGEGRGWGLGADAVTDGCYAAAMHHTARAGRSPSSRWACRLAGLRGGVAAICSVPAEAIPCRCPHGSRFAGEAWGQRQGGGWRRGEKKAPEGPKVLRGRARTRARQDRPLPGRCACIWCAWCVPVTSRQ